MPNRLFVDELVSVGMVPSGDNPEATVLIYKSHDPQDEVEGSRMISSAESASSTREVTMDLSVIEDQDIRKSVEDHIAGLESQISELQAPSEEEVVKAESDEVQEFIAKQTEEIASLRKDLDEERATRRTNEFITKAEPLVGLLGKAEDMGPILADIAAKAPESYEKLEGVLTAAAQREGMAKLFSELGTGEGEADADPIARRDAWVEKNRKDGEDINQARSRFWSENPDMVEESRS